jgi:hypothetical protein
MDYLRTARLLRNKAERLPIDSPERTALETKAETLEQLEESRRLQAAFSQMSTDAAKCAETLRHMLKWLGPRADEL